MAPFAFAAEIFLGTRFLAGPLVDVRPFVFCSFFFVTLFAVVFVDDVVFPAPFFVATLAFSEALVGVAFVSDRFFAVDFPDAPFFEVALAVLFFIVPFLEAPFPVDLPAAPFFVAALPVVDFFVVDFFEAPPLPAAAFFVVVLPTAFFVVFFDVVLAAAFLVAPFFVAVFFEAAFFEAAFFEAAFFEAAFFAAALPVAFFAVLFFGVFSDADFPADVFAFDDLLPAEDFTFAPLAVPFFRVEEAFAAVSFVPDFLVAIESSATLKVVYCL